MRKFTVLVCLCVVAVLPEQTASAGQSPSVETRAKDSEIVVVATVDDVRSRFGTNAYGDQVILSDLQLDVAETLKGASGRILTVTVEGGEIGDLVLRVSDMPVMRAGERAVFFLKQSGKGPQSGSGFALHGRGNGVLKLDDAGKVRDAALTIDDVRRSVRAASR